MSQPTIHLFSAGDFQADLADWLRVEPSDYPEHPELSAPVRFPMQALVIRLPEAVVVVDTPAYANLEGLVGPIPGDRPPPPVVEQMSEAGIAPEDVTHVIFTHAHFDHFNGATVEETNDLRPTFPNARYFLARADWDVIQSELAQPGSLQSRTFGVLQQAGRLELTEGEQEILPGIRVIPAAGESPGHQIVRVQLDDGVLYHTADLFHHELEIIHPDWACFWADVEGQAASRATLVEAALAEDALLVVSHIDGFGRLARTASGLEWKPATL